jgi:hypothetical protein
VYDVQLEGYNLRLASSDKQELRAITYGGGGVFISVRICRGTEEEKDKGDKNTARCSASLNFGCTDRWKGTAQVFRGLTCEDTRLGSDWTLVLLVWCSKPEA